MSLYDSERLKAPFNTKSKLSISWEDYFNKLKSILSQGKDVVFLTSSFSSPSLNNIIKDVKLKYKNFKVVFYDSSSYSGLMDSYEENVWGSFTTT